MIQNSKNAILYRGRYIRRIIHCGWAAECYAVAWAAGGREVETWYGCLEKLLKQIAEDDAFYGKWRWLI